MMIESRSGIGVGRAYGSCGELLQGVTAGDRHFLVTLPIRRGSVAVFEPGGESITVAPEHKSKARRLASAMIARSPLLRGGRLTVHSELPEGKGLASSTADLVATARAVADAEGRVLPVAELEADLRAIEPSDGVMYPGTVAYLHREVRLLARLGTLPALTIVTGDEGGTVDTVEFNREQHRFGPAAQREYDRLLDDLRLAVARGDAAGIGAVATRSAQLSTALRARPHLESTIRAASAIGAVGVVVAHSGTTTGILLADAHPRCREQLLAARRICAEFAGAVTVHHTWRPGPTAETRTPPVDHTYRSAVFRSESTPR
ncbi:GHMP family kinase ATP-binding protein [Nocardia rhizosphaerae]|uniref:GHMP kinase N-terminal domain-containing protein n=1 Tax=Nocardia rhizosphaerae TaxID=1691571 RepID=A0ABV8L9B2_9NOCA